MIKNIVYDVTLYLNCHPGGKDILMPSLGTDATLLFEKYHHWVND
jgi:cytochrome b involved in lipid metabolism